MKYDRHFYFEVSLYDDFGLLVSTLVKKVDTPIPDEDVWYELGITVNEVYFLLKKNNSPRVWLSQLAHVNFKSANWTVRICSQNPCLKNCVYDVYFDRYIVSTDIHTTSSWTNTEGHQITIEHDGVSVKYH